MHLTNNTLLELATSDNPAERGMVINHLANTGAIGAHEAASLGAIMDAQQVSQTLVNKLHRLFSREENPYMDAAA